MIELNQMTDKDLIDAAVRLAGVERAGQVELLRYLGEIDQRKLFLELGYGSLWDFCRRALQFSESVSQQRILVARAAIKHREILERLGDGSLSLCTAADLARSLSAENAGDLFRAAAGKSRREVQALVAVDGTKAPRRDVIRKVSGPADTTPDLDLRRVGRVEESKHRVAFTASSAVVAKLEELQALLGDAALEEVVDRATDLLLAKVDPAQRQERREARAAAKRPEAKKPRVVNPRRPGAALRDKVLNDSGQRCEFVSPRGVRCAETRHLSIDHIRPFALGGTSIDQSNLRCLCIAHNLHQARKSFVSTHPS